MTDWSWVETKGNTGELPLKIASGGVPKIPDGFAKGVQIGEYTVRTDDELRFNDVCVVACEIAEVDGGIPTTIDIDVYDVDYIHRDERSGTEVEDMMQHLDDARERRKAERKNECNNCGEISSSTRLTVKDDRQGRDLHYCSECGRLVSTSEYRAWFQTKR